MVYMYGTCAARVKHKFASRIGVVKVAQNII